MQEGGTPFHPALGASSTPAAPRPDPRTPPGLPHPPCSCIFPPHHPVQLGAGLASARKKEKASENEIIIKKVEKKEGEHPLPLSLTAAANEGLLTKGCVEQVASWAGGDLGVTPSWAERPKPAQKGPRHPEPSPPRPPQHPVAGGTQASGPARGPGPRLTHPPHPRFIFTDLI